MSYASARKATPDNAIAVGSKAGHDVILAEASYDASQILVRASRRRQGTRLAFIRTAIRSYLPDAHDRFDVERATLLRRGWSPNQATYDAMRLVISNALAREGAMAIRAALATRVSGEFTEGLGGISNIGRKIGCGITGGVVAGGSIVAGIYGGAAGAGAVGAGGSILGSALDCSKDEREAAQKLAEEQAAAAQQLADTALETARIQKETAHDVAQERTKQVKTAAVVGGATLLLLFTGYMIVKS